MFHSKCLILPCIVSQDMLTSQTVAARIRVFDLILNLGVHAHLLEPVDDPLPIVEEDASEESCLNTEDQGTAGNVDIDVSIQQKMASAVENFERWLLTILFEVLHLLVQVINLFAISQTIYLTQKPFYEPCFWKLVCILEKAFSRYDYLKICAGYYEDGTMFLKAVFFTLFTWVIAYIIVVYWYGTILVSHFPPECEKIK